MRRLGRPPGGGRHNVNNTSNKICNKCGVEKRNIDYAIRNYYKDGIWYKCRREVCKQCSIEVLNGWRQKNPDKVAETAKRMSKRHGSGNAVYKTYKLCGCGICGEKIKACLSFHHIDTKDKRKRQPSLLTRKQFLDEVLKCIVVCHNCHAKIHCGAIVLSELDKTKIQFIQLYGFLSKIQRVYSSDSQICDG